MTLTNTTSAALTTEQKDAIKTAAALVRMTWATRVGNDALLNLLQVAAQDALLTAFDKELVRALELFEDQDNASTARALTKLVREAQNKIAADAARYA